MSDPNIYNSLLNLGIGGASLAAMTFIVIQFLAALKEMRQVHEKAMNEREGAFRSLEKEVRTEILGQLGKNTQVMERVMVHMDKH